MPLALEIITAVAAIIFLAKWLRGKPLVTTYEDNHTIPIQKALEIATAITEERPAIFHGGCNGCIWRHQNTTHTGIAFCRGCQYFYANWVLPDKSITEYDLEKL
jgi:hypothetical protein